MSSPPILLHATPPLQELPASDAESLYHAALFQLACPGRWAVTTGEWGSNGGKLPYITHLGHQIRPQHLVSIPTYQDPDNSLSREEQVDLSCWKAYIEQNLVDLINHTFYSLPPNYPEVIAKAQFKHLAFPENQYIPQRLRSIVRSRLQHVGLWGMGGLNSGDAADEDRQKLDEAFVVGPAGTLAPRAWSGWTAGKDMEERRRKWGEQELVKRIKGVLDPLSRRLGSSSYFFGNRPSTLDLALFAQLTFALTPTLPNPILPDLMRSDYPSLVEHHDRILALLFPNGSWSSVPRAPRTAPTSKSYYDILSSWIPYASTKSSGNGNCTGNSTGPKTGDSEKQGKSTKEKQFERGRWLWFAGATVAMVGYLIGSGMVQVEFGKGPEEEWHEVDGEEEEEVLELDDDDEDVE